VGDAIVATLFAAGDTGRIPIGAVVGCHSADMPGALARRLEAAGLVSGLTCAAGRWVSGRCCSTVTHASPASAREALVAPDIDVLVCELDWPGIADAGLPVDRIDLLVLGPLTDAPGAAASAGPADVVRLLVTAVPADGTIVLAGADPWAADLARRGAGRTLDIDALPGEGDSVERLAAVVIAHHR
jgi:cyanophycin synthetase